MQAGCIETVASPFQELNHAIEGHMNIAKKQTKFTSLLQSPVIVYYKII